MANKEIPMKITNIGYKKLLYSSECDKYYAYYVCIYYALCIRIKLLTLNWQQIIDNNKLLNSLQLVTLTLMNWSIPSGNTVLHSLFRYSMMSFVWRKKMGMI